MPQVRQAARQAHIEAEIMRFPMQFNSLVCDMGTTRSSGQKQRILLARALYRTPRIVILDEGTAHIDPEREAQIRTMLRALPITRIIVAYCQAMAEIADRVLRLENGQLVAQSAPTEHARLPATNATMMQ